VLKTRDGFVQGYNGQLAVDAGHQIIVAQRLTTNGSDQAGLIPLVDAARAALGRKPREDSADAGFCREDNLAPLAARGIRGYLAPGRAAHGTADPSGRRRLKPGNRMAAMAAMLKRAGARAIACASRRASPRSVRSSRRAASASSCCAASARSGTNGR
jgi:hypothetical protein